MRKILIGLTVLVLGIIYEIPTISVLKADSVSEAKDMRETRQTVNNIERIAKYGPRGEMFVELRVAGKKEMKAGERVNLDSVPPKFESNRNIIDVFPGESIQAAIDQAVSGDTVHVHAGTYYENLSINGKNNIRMEGDGCNVTRINAADYPRRNSLLEIKNSSIIEIEGLHLIPGNETIFYTIDIPNVNGVLIRNNIIGDPAFDNPFAQTSGIGSGSPPQTIYNCIIESNQIFAWFAGLDLTSVYNSIINNNLIFIGGYNVVFYPHHAGIVFTSDSSNDYIYNNTIINSAQGTYYWGDEGDSLAGIFLGLFETTHHINLKNNLIKIHQPECGQIAGAILLDNTQNSSIKYNFTPENIIGPETSSLDLTTNIFNVADPLFANEEAKDFHEKSTRGRYENGVWVQDAVNSVCINAGDPASIYSNEPEPNGNRINIGTYGNTPEASKGLGHLPQPINKQIQQE